MTNHSDVKFFFCYDPELAKHIKSQGYSYITRAKHYSTGKEFTLFIYEKTMQPYIDEWNRGKN